MSAPLGYFLTWTSRGARLHGDERGSVDRRHNLPGMPTLRADAARVERTLRRMNGPPVVLDLQAREVAEHAIRDHAQKREWRIFALNVRSNHVHVVVDCRSHGELIAPEKAMQEFKSWASRRLRCAGLVESSARIWTDHGSTRWLNDEKGLLAAVDYVVRLQDDGE